MNRFEKTSNDLTALAPKWSERGHLLAALPKHLADAQEAIKSQQNIDKEMTDLSLIASAWLKSQQQKELLEARLKRFKETAGYPSMASVLASPAVVGITNKEQSMNNLDKAAEFGAMMGKMAADPGAQGNSQLYGVPGIDDATSERRFNLKANSPAEYARARNSYGDANSELYGLRTPAGFTEHNGSGVYSRDKTPKDRFNRDGSTKLNSQGRKDSVPASPWRSKPVSYKMDQFQNEKHYNEMANMNRANPPKDPNGVPAQRIAISNQQDSNAAQVLPFLAGKKFR